jgi:colanic acid biosynthesis glycosyl transferase WcaI
METRIKKKLRGRETKLAVIPNWSDSDVIITTPKEDNKLLRELGLISKLVVLIAGNIGRVQDIETIAECARTLRELSNIHFLFVGSGANAQWLKQFIRNHKLDNITLVGNRPRDEQSIFLNACDIALVALRKGMWGLGVPSRFYNHIAAGKPVIALLDKESEISRVVTEEKIGWVVEPGDINQLARCIRESVAKEQERREMGVRAREISVHKYPYETVMQQYEQLIADII